MIDLLEASVKGDTDQDYKHVNEVPRIRGEQINPQIDGIFSDVIWNYRHKIIAKSQKINVKKCWFVEMTIFDNNLIIDKRVADEDGMIHWNGISSIGMEMPN